MVGARLSMPDTFDGCGVLAQTEIGECAINENEGCAVDTPPVPGNSLSTIFLTWVFEAHYTKTLA